MNIRGCGIVFDTRQQARVLCMNVNVANGVAAGPALDRPHGRPASVPVDLGLLPVLPSKLPSCEIHAAARADFRLSDITRYLERLTYENIAGKAILPTWVEQPPGQRRSGGHQ